VRCALASDESPMEGPGWHGRIAHAQGEEPSETPGLPRHLAQQGHARSASPFHSPGCPRGCPFRGKPKPLPGHLRSEANNSHYNSNCSSSSSSSRRRSSVLRRSRLGYAGRRWGLCAEGGGGWWAQPGRGPLGLCGDAPGCTTPRGPSQGRPGPRCRGGAAGGGAPAAG